MDHFKRLLKEAYPNHAYPVRHKHKDWGMMRSFLTLGPWPGALSSMKGPLEMIQHRAPWKMPS
jgi:hypothetical protein